MDFISSHFPGSFVIVNRALLLAFFIVPVMSGAANKPSRSVMSVPKACQSVVKACRAAGFVPGKQNKHPGRGLWTGCVRPLAKGHTVKGVKGVSKRAADACLKARHPKAPRKS